jgi:hypothetical protein
MLPLLEGVVDWRLDNLKQWIVNLDAKTTDTRTRASREEAARAEKLLAAFFKVFGAFVPGVTCKFAGIQKSTEKWTVLVETDDGKIPVDYLSQGAGSVLCWIGTVLQRLYEIYPNSEAPEKTERALVLIDEVDAHMHPQWQRLLMLTLKQTFKEVQVITTTHSPLVVANVGLEQIVVLSREKGGGVHSYLPADELKALGLSTDLTALRADQLLTSPLFGLPSARSPVAGQRIARYAELRTKRDEELSDEQRHDRETLRRYIINELHAGELRSELSTELRNEAESPVGDREASKPVEAMSDEDLNSLQTFLNNLLDQGISSR